MYCAYRYIDNAHLTRHCGRLFERHNWSRTSVSLPLCKQCALIKIIIKNILYLNNLSSLFWFPIRLFVRFQNCTRDGDYKLQIKYTTFEWNLRKILVKCTIKAWFLFNIKICWKIHSGVTDMGGAYGCKMEKKGHVMT